MAVSGSFEVRIENPQASVSSVNVLDQLCWNCQSDFKQIIARKRGVLLGEEKMNGIVRPVSHYLSPLEID
jgi:hypothetical protein